jgi:hypothetical protein
MWNNLKLTCLKEGDYWRQRFKHCNYVNIDRNCFSLLKTLTSALRVGTSYRHNELKIRPYIYLQQQKTKYVNAVH